MDHFDEKILKARELKEHNLNLSIEKQVYVVGEYLLFERTDFNKFGISVMLPDSFIDMPLSLAKLKYPMEQRPTIIKTSLDTSVNITLNLLPQKINTEQLESVKNQYWQIIKKMQPSNRLYESTMDDSGELLIGRFDFKSPTIDGPLYTMMGFTSINGILLHIVFNCAQSKMVEWKPIAVQILNSIQLLKKSD